MDKETKTDIKRKHAKQISVPVPAADSMTLLSPQHCLLLR